MRVIDAIVSGERDAKTLAALCEPQLRKAKEAELIASLEGTWAEHHLFALDASGGGVSVLPEVGREVR